MGIVKWIPIILVLLIVPLSFDVFMQYYTAFASHSSLSVDITDLEFSPQILHVSVNDKVTWENISSEKQMIAPHPSHLRSVGFTLEQDEELSHIFKAEGVFYYFSLKNPQMRGAVVVGNVDYKNLDSEDIPAFKDGLIFSKNVVYSSPHANNDINCGKNDDCLIPSTIRIEVGETVHWKHYSSGTWYQYGGGGEPSFGFKVPVLPLGRSTHTFTEEGIYHYYYQASPWIRGTVIVGNPPPPTPETLTIPDKFQDVVMGWHFEERPESDFFFVVRYLANHGLITNTETGNQKLPAWFENIAVWWAEGKISDKDFINCIINLVERGIIQF